MNNENQSKFKIRMLSYQELYFNSENYDKDYIKSDRNIN